MSRETRISVTVKGEPVSDSLEFAAQTSRGGERRYRVTFLSREYYYGEGNWTPQRWQGVAMLIKKDGTVSDLSTTTYFPWKFEPDAQTVQQFADTARYQLARASDLRGRIA